MIFQPWHRRWLLFFRAVLRLFGVVPCCLFREVRQWIRWQRFQWRKSCS